VLWDYDIMTALVGGCCSKRGVFCARTGRLRKTVFALADFARLGGMACSCKG
jgi:hypothetical protein